MQLQLKEPVATCKMEAMAAGFRPSHSARTPRFLQQPQSRSELWFQSIILGPACCVACLHSGGCASLHLLSDRHSHVHQSNEMPPVAEAVQSQQKPRRLSPALLLAGTIRDAIRLPPDGLRDGGTHTHTHRETQRQRARYTDVRVPIYMFRTSKLHDWPGRP